MAKNLKRYAGLYTKGRSEVDLDTPIPAWVGIWTPERASQFMPFAALKGLEDLMEEEGALVAPRQGFDAQRAYVLDETLFSLRRGDTVEVTLYEEGKGQRVEKGMVTDMALELGWIEVDYHRVSLQEIDDLAREKNCRWQK